MSRTVSRIPGTLAAAAVALLLAACDSHDGGASAADAQDPGAGAAAPAAPGAATVAGAGQPAEVRRISIADARKAAAEGTAVFYDVRGEAAYDAGHIAGAKPLPGNEIEQRLGELPKDKLIVTYCA